MPWIEPNIGPFKALGGCISTIAMVITIGLFTSGQSFGGAVSALASAVILWRYFRFSGEVDKETQKQYSFLQHEEGFERYLMQLVSCVMKVDKKSTDSEFRYIQAALISHFDSEKVSRMMVWLRKSVELEIDYRHACKVVAFGISLSSKVQLMHLLVGIASADGYLSNKEYELVKDMARHMRIPFRTFQQILAMFRFTREGARQQKKTSSKRTIRVKTSLNEAYGILGILTTASNKAVKKAYRKLAVLHHPDKVAHMGKDFQKAAKEKFQKIQEAYEVVKKNRGMN
jgi:DnaJ like chaperone protein